MTDNLSVFNGIVWCFSFDLNFLKLENFRTIQWRMVRKFSRKNFQKVREPLNFWNANHSTESPENSGSKVEWQENFREEIFENLDMPREVFFLEISENEVPFDTGSCRNLESACYFQENSQRWCHVSYFAFSFESLSLQVTLITLPRLLSHRRGVSRLSKWESYNRGIPLPKAMTQENRIGRQSTALQLPAR